MVDIGKEAKRINDDLNEVNGLVSNPLFSTLLKVLGGLAIFVLLVLLLLKF